MYLEKRSYSLLIWKASSLVWHMTSTDTCRVGKKTHAFPESTPIHPNTRCAYYDSSFHTSCLKAQTSISTFSLSLPILLKLSHGNLSLSPSRGQEQKGSNERVTPGWHVFSPTHSTALTHTCAMP